MSNYTFSYFNREPDDSLASSYPIAKSFTSNFEFDDAAPWDIVMTEFMGFLSAIYGYDISKHVQIQTFQQRVAAFQDLGIPDEDNDEDPFDTQGREFR